MATFRVGQKVRVVRCCIGGPSEFIGRIGEIIEHNGLPDSTGHMWDYDVDMGEEDRIFTCDADCLEPIQPEGYKVVTWAECPWQPKDWQPKREEQVA